MVEQTDLVILGGGTGGYVAAIRAAQAGLKVTVIEKYRLGGTCLHKGCIPTKALLRSAEVCDTIKRAEEFGLEKVTHPVVNFVKIQERKRAIIDKLTMGIQSLLKKNKVKVLEGTGVVLGPSIFSPVSGAIAVTFNDRSKEEQIIVPKNVIIATGSHPKTLPSFPIDEKRILSSDGMLELEKLPKSIVIVGGGVIGVEWASLLHSFGVEVTIVEYADRLMATESPTISKALEKAFKKRGIKVLTGKKVLEPKIGKKSIEVLIEGSDSVAAEVVMMAIGRAPNVDNIGLEATSIEFDAKGIKVNEHYQTKEKHIYAIGDVIDTLQLAHVAMKEGELAVQHLQGLDTPVIDYYMVPRGVYCDPEIASVGYVKGREPDREVKLGSFSFTANGKALVYGQGEGCVEAMRDAANDDLLGLSIIGPHATDLISEASTAIYLDATPIELGSAIHPHPTLTEVLQEACLDTYGRAIHK